MKRVPRTPGQGGAQNDESVAILNRARTGDRCYRAGADDACAEWKAASRRTAIASS